MKEFLGKVKFWMDKSLSIACAVLLSFMTILVLIQVFSRYVLNSPVAFTEELVRYSLNWPVPAGVPVRSACGPTQTVRCSGWISVRSCPSRP